MDTIKENQQRFAELMEKQRKILWNSVGIPPHLMNGEQKSTKEWEFFVNDKLSKPLKKIARKAKWLSFKLKFKIHFQLYAPIYLILIIILYIILFFSLMCFLERYGRN